MNSSSQVTSVGEPDFQDPALAQMVKDQGVQAAWLAAMKKSPDALASARGHFAVGATDAEGQTLLAVDRFATQTMCWSNHQGQLAFSPRADTLATAPDDIDPQALFDYFYFHTIPSPRTVFKGVNRLPPGHALTSTPASGIQLQRYWQPRFEEVPQDFASAKKQFLALMEAAVQRQLDGSRPAAFLSGGTDSSTVAGMLAKVGGQPPATYSIGFEAEGYDEMAYARIAAKHFGTEHHEHYITPADLVRLIPEMAAHHDQPFGNSSAVPAYFCALKARADGVTRLLAGDGGDELFGGNTRYAKQSVFAWYEGIPAGLRQACLEPISQEGGLLSAVPLLKKGTSYVRQAKVPMPDRLQTYNLLGRIGQDRVLTPAFLAMVDTQGPQAQERRVWAESAGANFVNRMLAYDWRYTLAENDLPKVRGSTERAGVAVSYPFLDQDLVDFSARLPMDFKLRRLKLRWFFKEALRGFLPDAIITKKKHGFGLPFGPWAVRDAGLRALAQDSVRGLGDRGIVRADFTQALVDDLLPQHPGYYGEMVWILMMLEQWFRHHAPNYKLKR